MLWLFVFYGIYIFWILILYHIYSWQRVSPKSVKYHHPVDFSFLKPTCQLLALVLRQIVSFLFRKFSLTKHLYPIRHCLFSSISFWCFRVSHLGLWSTWSWFLWKAIEMAWLGYFTCGHLVFLFVTLLFLSCLF